MRPLHRSKRPLALVAALASGVAAVLVAFPTTADAQSRRSAYAPRERYIYYGDQGQRRVVVVRKRSFLDPGPEPLKDSQHYHDYALSPSYSVFPKFFDYNYTPGSGVRAPLPDTFDLPGYRRW